MSWRPHGRVRVSSRTPQAAAICDRCGFAWNHVRMRFQFDWRSEQLQNLRILVCPRCEDIPQEQLRARILSPDPVPIFNARPEPFAAAGVNYDETNFITNENLLFQIADEATGAAIVAEGWFG